MSPRFLLIPSIFFCVPFPIFASGLLIPSDRSLAPLALVKHHVSITIVDQVATTEVEQTFRNHTNRQLEAIFVFPIPRRASVNRFTMYIEGKEVGGDLVEADKARLIYNDIVRRSQDPGLLEYIGSNLLRLRVFPVMPLSDQKIKVRFTSICEKASNLIEYIYPLKTDGNSVRTLENFSLDILLKSQTPIQTVYSPTHLISINRKHDREVLIHHDKSQAILDKDFQLFFSLANAPIGLSSLMFRPISSEPGYFMLFVSPQIESAKSLFLPRDLVLVLDTSGSMAGIKIDQAKKALKFILSKLHPHDRFSLIYFSTSVNRYRDHLVDANSEYIANAHKWVDGLRASGGTAIQAALESALELRPRDLNRSFTIVFFTDGQPTIGETNPHRIVKSTLDKNTNNTRIFTFGVGDDVNADMLDQLAEQTRAVSTYVRPAEDIQTKTAALFGKISHPVLTNIRISTGDNVHFEETYPSQLPDLFYGTQLVLLGRYSGSGPSTIRLSGQVGSQKRDFVYELNFPERTEDNYDFVEHIWARRKVGFILDQIRLNGEKRELLDEVISLSKKYGIATPYTSYLIVPDGVSPIAYPKRSPSVNERDQPTPQLPPALGSASSAPGAPRPRVVDVARQNQSKPGDLANNRGRFEEHQAESGKGDSKVSNAIEQKKVLDEARSRLARRDHTGKTGVDLALIAQNLRNQDRLAPSAIKQVNGRRCMEFGGIWIDEGFTSDVQAIVVKAQSQAYFRILDRHPKMNEVFRLGNHLVWITPSKQALVIDSGDGKEELTDLEIDRLFVVSK